MPYIELSDIKSEIPTQHLVQALDDDGDGEIDAWAEVQTAACEDVDALLEGRFAVPLTLSPLPRIIKRAAIAIACDRCYRRRGTPDQENPWKSRADAFVKMLKSITAGELKLSVVPDADAAVADPAGSVIIHDSPLGPPGRILA
jgi:phage gp36-like protein